MTGGAFLDACMRKQVDHTPVWFMRQAGRYLPSYRKVRTTKGMLEIAKDPELASDVTVDPVKELGVDAAVMFADIMLPLEGIGVKFKIEENVGPVIEDPIESMEDVEALGDFDPERHVPNVLETIRLAEAKLDGVPLVGFSGAPFTLASYLIEGSPTRDFQKTKRLMYTEPDTWRVLMSKLAKVAASYLGAQVREGVEAVQLFESWVGCLGPSDYQEYAKRWTSEIFGAIGGRVPTIHFCAQSSALVEAFASTGCDVVSVDWRVPIGSVWKRTGGTKGVQGNLDPSVAAAGGAWMEREVSRILEEASGKRGHVFNLGHGVLRDTPPENLRRVVELVHGRGSR